MNKEIAIGQRWRYTNSDCDLILEVSDLDFTSSHGFKGYIIQKIKGYREVGRFMWDYKDEWHSHFTYLPNQDKNSEI